MNIITNILLSTLLAALSANAFSPSITFSGRRVTYAKAVVDIDSEDAFDRTISSAGGSLVIVDYSTTWCGPCKVIAPKFDDFSEKYPDAVFLKVRRETRSWW
jgi:thioredoxin 1